ncbi:hypothetical protein [Desulfitobacterium chlororespirans]|uniref:Uncharacterized protein n=1 Tax=Desulfitobacterium chlororespirans DSM 11544 TaxID=1121395 RepID=A0A1M7U320_9FIRM|nr:hypothetical protein [Desulfitobacterium chlororespirans]SHN77399.1 hypothetical protein SAMN02745215_02880 [Desulfitobacterium chlororespirans DSM 11544]
MIKSLAVNILVYFCILVMIDAVWQILEITEFGQIQPSMSDRIIGMLFAYSLLRHIYPGGKKA